MKKTQGDFDAGIGLALDQALGLHQAWFSAILSDRVLLRIDPTERKPLARVLLRGRPVGVENIALVKHSLDDLVQQRGLHVRTSFDSGTNASKCSIVCSQVARPCERLWRYSRSNTSRFKYNQALFGKCSSI